MGIISYAQNFEDVILWRVLEDATPGFYVDVGAQHPVVDSVSKAFYEQGWRGIHVEPITEYANLLRTDRPDETVLQAVVAEQPGVVTFYEIPATGLSTARQVIAEEHEKKLGCNVVKNLVTAVTLDDVLALCPGDTIHWLKIDVEGFEREVLSGWRSSTHRPWVVVIEATYPNTTRDTFEDWEDLILAKGYELVYRDGLNRFYLHQTQADRKVRFVFPPNVFDGFQLSGTATSCTAALVNRHQQDKAHLQAEKDHAQHEAVRLNAECQKRVAEGMTRQETPISRPVSSEQANPGGVSRQFLIKHYFPTAVLEHTRFFDTWLRRIAPDTHQDQASGDETACRPGGFAAPEERWCRCVSKGCFTFVWLPISRRQSVSGSRSGRSVSLQIGDGDMASNSFARAGTPVSCFGLPAAVITHGKLESFDDIVAAYDYYNSKG